LKDLFPPVSVFSYPSEVTALLQLFRWFSRALQSRRQAAHPLSEPNSVSFFLRIGFASCTAATVAVDLSDIFK